MLETWTDTKCEPPFAFSGPHLHQLDVTPLVNPLFRAKSLEVRGLAGLSTGNMGTSTKATETAGDMGISTKATEAAGDMGVSSKAAAVKRHSGSIGVLLGTGPPTGPSLSVPRYPWVVMAYPGNAGADPMSVAGLSFLLFWLTGIFFGLPGFW